MSILSKSARRLFLLAGLLSLVLSACGGRTGSSSTTDSGSDSGGTTPAAEVLALNIDGPERPTTSTGSWIADSNVVLTLTCDRDCDFTVKSPSSSTTFESVASTSRKWTGTLRNTGQGNDVLAIDAVSKADAAVRASPSVVVRPDLAYRIKLAAGNTDVVDRNTTTVKVLPDTRLDIQNLNNKAEELFTDYTSEVTNIDGSALTDLSPYGAFVNGTTSGVPLKGEQGVWAFQFAAAANSNLAGFDVKLTKANRQSIFKIRLMGSADKVYGGQIVNTALTNKPQCSACHGTDGASPNTNGANKTINGKTPIATINLIRAYRDGKNTNATSTYDKRTRMNQLTPEEVMAVAWYLSEK